MVSLSARSKGCDFCALARGESRSTEILSEEKNWIAFFPLNPATPGHTLIIPRIHVVDLWELEPPLSGELMEAVILVGRAIDTALSPDGMNLITSAGKTAEQSIFHLHLHIVPRWHRDGFGRIWPAEGKFEDASLEDFADRIREALNT